MNKNIDALYKAHNISKDPIDNISLDKIYTVFFIIFNIVNLIQTKKIGDLAESNTSMYFLQYLFTYFISIISNFIMIYGSSIEEINKYIPMFYLPITSREFFVFFNLLKIKRTIILIVLSLVFFLISTIKLNLSLFFLSKITLIIIAFTLVFYFIINIAINLMAIVLSASLFKLLLKFSKYISWLLIILGNPLIVKLNKYFAKYLLSSSININLVIFLLLLSLIIFLLYYFNSILIKYVFNKLITNYQNFYKIGKSISINSIKRTSSFNAYVKNELALFKTGIFKYFNNFCVLVMVAWFIVYIVFGNKYNFINCKLFILINIISLISDVSLMKYNILSVFSLNEYLPWTKYTCVDFNVYFTTKLIIKGILNTINYIILICLLYLVMYLQGHKSNILTYSLICYLNVWIIAYFNNNLDFKYNDFKNNDSKGAFKILYNMLQKVLCCGLSKIFIFAFGFIIFRFMFDSIYISMLITYSIMLGIIYLDLDKIQKF